MNKKLIIDKKEYDELELIQDKYFKLKDELIEFCSSKDYIIISDTFDYPSRTIELSHKSSAEYIQKLLKENKRLNDELSIRINRWEEESFNLKDLLRKKSEAFIHYKIEFERLNAYFKKPWYKRIFCKI